jgi:hypothetical protein
MPGELFYRIIYYRVHDPKVVNSDGILFRLGKALGYDFFYGPLIPTMSRQKRRERIQDLFPVSMGWRLRQYHLQFLAKIYASTMGANRQDLSGEIKGYEKVSIP